MSTQYADDRRLTPFRKDFLQLKHVTPGHFVWVTYDGEGKQVRRAGGGTWTLSGDDYTEQLEYGLGEDVLPLLGKSTTFKVKL